MLVNTTVSHISPLLNYIPRSAWYEATLAGDPNLLSYPNVSYHATNSTTSGRASVSFSWYGTGLWVFGGYISFLGPYTVTLDGDTTTYDGYTGGPDQYEYQLYGISDLPVGKHHISIANTGTDPARPVLDLDYLVFEGRTDSTTTVDHTSDQCVWIPHSTGAWVIDESTHTTSLASGMMGMNFTGTGVAVYGSLDAHSAPFSVSVDGAPSPPLSPNTAIVNPYANASTLLYVKTGLLQGSHEVWVANDPATSGPNATATKLSISSVVVFSDADASAQNPGPAPSTQTSMAANSTKIFAAAFGSLGVILLAVLIWRLALRHRRRAHRRTDTVTPRPFLAPPGAAPPKPPSLSARPLTSAALAPLRRPSSTSHAPGYSTAATAPSSPESPWSPEGPAPARRPRSTDKPPRRLLLRSPAPMSPPSARVLPHRDRGAYEFLLSGSLSPPRETFGFGGDAEMGELGLPPSQMPPPYHFLDLH